MSLRRGAIGLALAGCVWETTPEVPSRDPRPLRPIRTVAAGLPLLLAVGCAGGSARSSRLPAAAEPAAPAPSAAPVRTDAELDARGWGDVPSLRFSLVVRLPERRAWTVDDQTSHWLLLRHPPSQSELRLRAWRAARLVHPDDCERQARLWRPQIPTSSASTTLDRRKLAKPTGYTTRAIAGVRPLGHTGTLEGFVLAFGATIGHCFAFVYTTHASGPGAETAIGDRLALMTDGVLPAVRMRSIDDRVR